MINKLKLVYHNNFYDDEQGKQYKICELTDDIAIYTHFYRLYRRRYIKVFNFKIPITVWCEWKCFLDKVESQEYLTQIKRRT